MGLLLIVTGIPAISAETGETARYGTLFANIDRSEWCPSGSIFIDLQSGRYQLTKGASRTNCHSPDVERPLTEGLLGEVRLRAIRASYSVALEEGLLRPECARGEESDTIVVSNGGPLILVLTAPYGIFIGPEDLSCLSVAGWDLHNLVEDFAEAM